MLSKKQIEDYKKIYRKKFNRDIFDQEALGQATKLLSLIEAIYKFRKSKELKELKKVQKSK